MDEGRFRDAEVRLWRSLEQAPVEHMVDLPRIGTGVRVQETGDGPPVLFLHGGSVCGTCWATLAAALPDHRCLLVDRPGCGLSPAMADPPGTFEALARFGDHLVGDLLDGLGLDRAHVAATSFGGWFALRSAAAEPARIQRLVLYGFPVGAPVGSTPLSMRLGAIPVVAHNMGRIKPPRMVVRRLLESIGLKDAIRNGRFSDEMFAWFESMLRDTDTLSNEATTLPPILSVRGGLNPELHLDDELLGRVQTPTKLFWGENDPFGGADTGRAFTARLPRASLEMLAHAGHAPWMDDADRAAAALREHCAPAALEP